MRSSNLPCSWPVRSIESPLERHDPVRFPRLAAVVREGLLETRRIRRDPAEAVPHEDLPVVKRLLIEELAPPVPELTDDRRGHDSVAAVGPVEVPLLRARVVEAQPRALDVSGRTVHFELEETGPAVPDSGDFRDSVVLHPGGGARQRLLQP